MKKMLIPFVFTIVLNQVNAQKVRVGFGAGPNLSNMYAKQDNEKDNGESKLGYNIKLFADFPFSKSVSIQPAFNFIQKGFKEGSGDEKLAFNINYIEIPLNIVYYFNPETDGNFFIGAGPYIAAPLYGNAKIKFDGDSHKESLNFGNSEDDDLRRLDVGANVMAGIILNKKLVLSAFYSRGFYDLSSVRSEGSYLHNQSFGINIGWLVK